MAQDRGTAGSGSDAAALDAALAAAPLFRGLSERHVREIAGAAKVRSYAAGATVVAEGAVGSSMFVVLEGDARVTARGRRIGSLGAGDFFGEVALLARGPRTATVAAVGTLRCVELPGEEFERVLDREPTMAAVLLRTVAARLRDATGYRPTRMERLLLYS